MTALLAILGLWRGRAAWLVIGAVVALASALSGAVLLALAGAHLAVMLMGGGVAAGALLMALGPVRVVLRYMERLVTHNATFRALADLRVWFFDRLAQRSAGGLGMERSGDLAARLVNDVETLDGLYLRILVPLGVAVLLFAVLALVLVGFGDTEWPLGLAACALFAAAAFVVPALAARAAAKTGAEQSLAVAGLRIAVLDALSGLREVKAFAAEERMLSLVRTRDAAAAIAQARLARRSSVAQAAGFLCGQAALAVMLLGAGARPVFVAGAVFLLVGAFEAASGLPRAGALAAACAAAARRVLGASKTAILLADPAQPAALPKGTSLKLEGIRFRWAPDRAELFDSLSMDIPQGTRVAILGPSGSGKSTLAALLLRVVAPSAGRVLIDGMDIATLSAADLRSRFTWLSQSSHLFDDTIRANLLLGRPGADDTALWQALDEAEIGDFVRSLPDGLDTWLGEGGARVSGGQGRRIALARALLSPAPILVLDEPGAGLDAQTERALLQTLNGLKPGRTLLLICHRLTGVEKLDRIWRLSGGHAVAAAA